MSDKPKRVTGIGGIFFKCKDSKSVKDWYANHLGIAMDDYGTSFEWRHVDSEQKGYTAWSPMPETTKYFDPAKKEFMINYRVENLVWLVEQLKAEGVQVVDEIEEYDYGKFVHILDPEGNKIELWEPKDDAYDDMIEVKTS